MPKAPRTPKPKKPWNGQAKAIQALRKVWKHSPMRAEAIAAARDARNPKHLVCAKCGVSMHEKLAAIDHVVPVVGPEGFRGWDEFFSRLMCPASNLQALCEACHKVKTKEESANRAAHRRSLKPPKPAKAPKPPKPPKPPKGLKVAQQKVVEDDWNSLV